MSPTAPQKETHNAANSAAFRYKSFHTKPNEDFLKIPPGTCLILVLHLYQALRDKLKKDSSAFKFQKMAAFLWNSPQELVSFCC